MCTFTLLVEAMKAHFLTLRRRKKQEDSGKRAAVLQTERRRNRIPEVRFNNFQSEGIHGKSI